LRQSGVKVAADGPGILLFSRAGFNDNLETAADERGDLRLVGIEELVEGLLEGQPRPRHA